MKAGSGMRKGGAFERYVCTVLSLWLTAGLRDDVLWRSATSGGRATQSRKQGKEQRHISGDICAVHPLGNHFVDLFYTECKFRANLALEAFVFKEATGSLLKYWERTVEEAVHYSKLPMLIAKQNRIQPFVVLNDLGVAAIAGLSTRKKIFCRLSLFNSNVSLVYLEDLVTVQPPHTHTEQVKLKPRRWKTQSLSPTST